jgi:hypothetical protein
MYCSSACPSGQERWLREGADAKRYVKGAAVGKSHQQCENGRWSQEDNPHGRTGGDMTVEVTPWSPYGLLFLLYHIINDIIPRPSVESFESLS